MKKRDEFYSDLDTSKTARESKKSCSCQALVIFFVLLLIVLELSLFFVARSIKSGPKDVGFVSPEGQLEMKGSGIDIGDGRFALSVSQGMLCSSLLQAKVIQNLSCAISEEGITVAGKFSSYLPSNARIVLVPQAKDGRVDFETKRVTIGSIPVPSFLSSGLDKTLNSALYKSFPDLEKAEVLRVELQEAVMTITAKKR